jgi:hypothetical protein
MAFSQAIVEALGQAGASHQIGSWTWPMELGCEQSGKHARPVDHAAPGSTAKGLTTRCWRQVTRPCAVLESKRLRPNPVIELPPPLSTIP